MRYFSSYPYRNAIDMSDLDPERLTLRQAAQARDDFAQVMDERAFVKEADRRIPTRRDQRLSPCARCSAPQSSAPRSCSAGSSYSGGITCKTGIVMRLPEVATRLRELATDLGCRELNELADEIARRPTTRPTSAHHLCPDD